MSGHSKWANIKYRKGAQDAKRGATFSKLAKMIEVAARGGPDPNMNFRLKLAIQKARMVNMPGGNIERAIKKGSGTDKHASRIEAVTYEGLGPSNIGVVVEALTDNKNRTVAELRHLFTKYGGSFGTSVAWQFTNRGILQVVKSDDGEAQQLAVIDAGATDFDDGGDVLEVYTDPKKLDAIKSKIEAAGFIVRVGSLGLVPKDKTTVADAAAAKQALGLLDALDERDDVANVYSTLDIPDEVLNQLG